MGDLLKLGPQGETFALKLLRKNGHQLLQKNFACPQGEIDLITWHRGTLVFTEVRARQKAPQRHPLETVTPEKERRIIRASNWYLAKRTGGKPPPPCRYDIVWLEAEGETIVDWGVIEGAFSA